MNKSLLFTLVAILTMANLSATLVDLGSSGAVRERSLNFSGLEGIQFAGQSLSLDFNFANNSFIRVYSTTNGLTAFSAVLDLLTNTPDPGFLIGSGYVIDSLGQRYAGTIGQASTAIGLYPFWRDIGGNPFNGVEPIPGIPTPLDIYGIHYDLILPTTVATQIVSSRIILTGLEIPNRQGFDFFSTTAIGPGIPDQIPPVPDTGSTILLLGTAVFVLGLRRRA